MRKILLFLILFVCSVQVMKAQDADNPYVHCLVLDKTKSMTGSGGTNIWSDVQNYCYEWIDGIPESSTVLFFTFDQKLTGPQKFVINSDSDKKKFKAAVKNVNVDGQRTWISSNLNEVVKHIHDNYPKSKYNCRIYLVTDGKEEQPEANFAGVLRNYGSWRGDYDYLYYVDLRDMAPQETKNEIEKTPGADYGKGFPKFLTISPLFKDIYLTLGKKSFEQHFIVPNENLFSDMPFDVKIGSVKAIGGNTTPNVSITPSRNITKSSMKKMEDGKFKMTFNVDFANSTPCECDIVLKLEGRNQGDKIINFEPREFTIKVRKKKAPKVTVKKGIGWH